MRFRFLSIISLIIGIALFIYLLKQSGTTEILDRVRTLGWGFILILAISALRQCARTYAWLRCMSDDARSLGFFTVLRARLAGDALADLTAAGPIVGEPIKLAKLKGKARISDLASSLAVENLAYAVSAGLMILAGTLSFLSYFALSAAMRQASWFVTLVVSVMLISAFLLVKMQCRLLSNLAGRIFPLCKYLTDKVQRVYALETYVFDFYAQRTTDFLIVAACEMLFHLLGVLEIFTALKLLHFDATLFIAFILEAVNRVMNIAFAFVPAMIGVDEAGTGLLTSLLGLGISAGVTLALVRKARMICWIGLGVIFLGNFKTQTVAQSSSNLKE